MNAFQQWVDGFRAAQVGIIGLGVSNRPLAEMLAGSGAQVTVFDKDDSINPAPWLARGVTLTLGQNYLDALEGEVVFRTPGLRPDHPALERVSAAGGRVTSEMQCFFELCPCPVIAVTGSDGKTTTTSLIAEMLRAEGKTVWLGGNIGTPLLCRIPEMTANDIAVVELSSFQLMDMTRSPQIAVVTNITPNHLDWHIDMDEYIDAKRNILRYQSPGDRAVLNADNTVTAGLKTVGETEYFGWSVDTNSLIGGLLEPSEIFLRGRHNRENFMAAIAAVRGLVSPEAIRHVAATFPGVEHRNQYIATVSGVEFYNDSMASSPTRTIASLTAYEGTPVVLICGGYDKKLSYQPLAQALPGIVKSVVLIGETAAKIQKEAEAITNSPPMTEAGSMDEAVQAAFARASPGDVVLLSPASASFDWFRDYAHRGQAFIDAVGAIRNRPPSTDIIKE